MVDFLGRVQKSRALRQRILSKFGRVPSSVLVAKAVNTSREFTRGLTGASQEEIRESLRKGKISPEEAQAKLKMTWVSNTKEKSSSVPGYSRFPSDVCDFLVKYYSQLGETVYDPCAGHNSRMEIVWRNGRNYVGYDISLPFMEANEEIKNDLLTGLGLFESTSTIELFCRDNRSCHLEDDSIDFTFTSPPYWNLEFYGEEPEQLGYRKTYREFLEELSKMISEQFRVLKPGRFCALNVNDIRKNKQFIVFHADVISICQKIGFLPWDMLILVWGSPRSQIFVGQLARWKYLGKDHEYVLIFRKPGGEDFWKDEFEGLELEEENLGIF